MRLWWAALGMHLGGRSTKAFENSLSLWAGHFDRIEKSRLRTGGDAREASGRLWHERVLEPSSQVKSIQVKASVWLSVFKT